LTLEDHGGRTITGVYSRVAARLLALAAAIWHNWLIDAPNKRSHIAYDH
ncbi:MAG: IS982 family transposase, partial [Leifsonia sp.]